MGVGGNRFSVSGLLLHAGGRLVVGLCIGLACELPVAFGWEGRERGWHKLARPEAAEESEAEVEAREDRCGREEAD